MFPLHYKTTISFVRPADWSKRKSSFLQALRDDLESDHFEFNSNTEGLEATVNAFGTVRGIPWRFGHVDRLKIEVHETNDHKIEITVKLTFRMFTIIAALSWVVVAVPLLTTRRLQALLAAGGMLVICLLMFVPVEFFTALYVKYRISRVWSDTFATDS